MKKGLVLCGGGSKGSYEMGAWTALEELGEKFEIVTGTSIGCLNAAMYAQHAYDRCLELWNKIEVGMIMESGINFENNSFRNQLKKKNDLLTFMGKYVSNMGTDIKPFLKLIDEYIDEDKILSSDIKFGICCARFPSFKGVEVVANEEIRGLIKQYILASTSCFPIFPVCKIGKESFVDGGYYDNLPINFALDLGATDITVIDLNPNITHPEFVNKPFTHYIHPSHDLGAFMHFDREIIAKNMALGYNDTMKSFGKYMGYRYTFFNEYVESPLLRALVLKLMHIYAANKKNKVKSLIKPESDGDLFNIISMYTDYKSLTDFDYLIRGLEILGEIIEIDYIKIYHIKEFFKEVIDELMNVDDESGILDGYATLSPAKRRAFLFKQNDKRLFKYLAQKIMGSFTIDEELIIDLVAAKPKVLIAIVIFEAYYNEIGELFDK